MLPGSPIRMRFIQYRCERNPKTRLFLFRQDAWSTFAMDLEEVYMTTKLSGDLLSFCRSISATEKGVNAGAGNPTFKDIRHVSYMCEDISHKGYRAGPHQQFHC